MQRRTFVRIALGLVIGPSAAAAQPKGKIYRIGVLSIANRPHGPRHLTRR